MRKIWIFIAMIFISIPLIGQDKNRLNEMLTGSIFLYLDYKTDLHSKVCKNCGPYILPYICKDGLPCDFPCDSLQQFNFFSLNNIEGYPKSFKEKLNKGIGVWFVGIKLMKNQIVITISSRGVKRTKKNHIGITVGEWGIFTYEYSCENQQWIIINTEYGGI